MKTKHFICVVYILFVYCHITNGQNSTIVFHSDKTCEALIFSPIDEAYNYRTNPNKIQLSASKTTSYKLEVSSPVFLHIKFPQQSTSCDVIVSPQDTIAIFLKENNIQFQGNNHVGQQYQYDNFGKQAFMSSLIKIEEIYNEYTQGKRNISTIIPAIDQALHISGHISSVEQMPLENKTTTEFAHLLSKNISSFFSGLLIPSLQGFLKFKITVPQDSIYTSNVIDSICKMIPLKPELNTFPSGSIYINQYLHLYYGQKGCPDGYDKDTFGPYYTLLYAPKEMQPALFGNAFSAQLKYNSNEMNLKKLKSFLNDNFPKSEYTTIINQMVKEETTTETEFTTKQLFIKDNINSLAMLKNLPALKGKYIFIDLWASWCMPCRAEFSYIEQLHQILNVYKDISTVYISIDDKKQEKAWLNCIKYYKLEGAHLMASPQLYQDIQKQIYGTERFEVPRYVLMSPKGEILNNNLPRPSEYTKLKEEIHNIFEK